MTQLEDEIAAYDRLKPQLVVRHPDKWVIVQGQQVVGIFDSLEGAAEMANMKFAQGPWIVRGIGTDFITMPAHALHEVLKFVRQGSDRAKENDT